MPETARLKQVKHFMACDEGRQFLDGIRAHLKGHTIDDVSFINNLCSAAHKLFYV